MVEVLNHTSRIVMSPPQHEAENYLVERAASKFIDSSNKSNENWLSSTCNQTTKIVTPTLHQPKNEDKLRENTESNNNNKENLQCHSASANLKPQPKSKFQQKLVGQTQGQKKTRNSDRSEPTSPTEFFHMGSLKSHAMAGKTQTASKLAGNNSQLMADLLGKGGSLDTQVTQAESVRDQKSVELLSEELGKVTIEEPTGEDLLVRGPVRATKTGATCFPYPQPRNTTCNSNQQGPSDNSPSSVFSEQQKSQQQEAPFADKVLHNGDLNRLLNVSEELPEDLSDFILKYSRRYSTDTPPTSWTPDLAAEDSEPPSRKNSSSGSSTSGSPKHRLSGFRPRSATDESSPCDSPMSAGTAPQTSPAGPNGSQTPGTPTSLQQAVLGAAGAANNPSPPVRYKPILPKQLLPSGRKGKARDRLLSLFSESQKEAAWIWAVKCVQSCPGALYYRDPDGDSLLHIVVWHRDLAKVYALVEQMLKTEYPPCRKPFDLPNRFHETPLFLAVEKRAEELVSYLLECGANPNFQSRRPELDGPLHYAAARGMVEIVQAFCSHQATDKNLRNGLGLTPLLYAVKNHGVIEEESQCLVNNKPTIRALLKSGADPKIPDATNGKTVLHYSVERMDPELVEIFHNNLDREEMKQLVNLPDYVGETVINLLGRMSRGPRNGTGLGRFEAEDELRRKMFVTLVNCGAEIGDVSSEITGSEQTNIGDSVSPYTSIGKGSSLNCVTLVVKLVDM